MGSLHFPTVPFGHNLILPCRNAHPEAKAVVTDVRTEVEVGGAAGITLVEVPLYELAELITTPATLLRSLEAKLGQSSMLRLSCLHFVVSAKRQG